MRGLMLGLILSLMLGLMLRPNKWQGPSHNQTTLWLYHWSKVIPWHDVIPELFLSLSCLLCGVPIPGFTPQSITRHADYSAAYSVIRTRTLGTAYLSRPTTSVPSRQSHRLWNITIQLYHSWHHCHVGIFPVTPQESTIFKTTFRTLFCFFCVQNSLPSDSPSAQHEAHVACSEDQPRHFFTQHSCLLWQVQPELWGWHGCQAVACGSGLFSPAPSDMAFIQHGCAHFDGWLHVSFEVSTVTGIRALLTRTKLWLWYWPDLWLSRNAWFLTALRSEKWTDWRILFQQCQGRPHCWFGKIQTSPPQKHG